MVKIDQSMTLAQVSEELERLQHTSPRTRRCPGFPISCYRLLQQLPGNQYCTDCSAANPEWASVSYGILLCLQCSGRHRSYGVKTSFVRSLRMDAWEHSEVLRMLEGGNGQLLNFFDRHQMGNSTPQMISRRYLTKAALFYRTHLFQHVDLVARSGPYQGRHSGRDMASATENTTCITHIKDTRSGQTQPTHASEPAQSASHRRLARAH